MWLETVIVVEAAMAFSLSGVNVALLLRALAATRGAARRAAVVVLACVCGAQALEALLFLWQGEASGAGWSAAAVLLVRTALLVSTALISLLLTRALVLSHRG